MPLVNIGQCFSGFWLYKGPGILNYLIWNKIWFPGFNFYWHLSVESSWYGSGRQVTAHSVFPNKNTSSTDYPAGDRIHGYEFSISTRNHVTHRSKYCQIIVAEKSLMLSGEKTRYPCVIGKVEHDLSWLKVLHGSSYAHSMSLISDFLYRHQCSIHKYLRGGK